MLPPDTDEIHERNARLVVRLQRLQRELHDAQHHPSRWPICAFPSCAETASLVHRCEVLHES